MSAGKYSETSPPSYLNEEAYGGLYHSSKEFILNHLSNTIDVIYNDPEVDEYHKWSHLEWIKTVPPALASTKNIAARLEAKAIKQTVKLKAIKDRRNFFAQIRAQQVLALLAMGVNYVCVINGKLR